MTPRTIEEAAELANRIETQLNQVLIGQPAVTRQVMLALITGGHVLIEGVPGLGKTKLVEILGTVLGMDSRRVQFTPDLMLADILGSEDALGESLRTLAWGHALRFEAADEATATRLIGEVRRAAERGLHRV